MLPACTADSDRHEVRHPSLSHVWSWATKAALPRALAERTREKRASALWSLKGFSFPIRLSQRLVAELSLTDVMEGGQNEHSMESSGRFQEGTQRCEI